MTIRAYSKKVLLSGSAALLLALAPLEAQQPRAEPKLSTDSDHDGLSDVLEQRLLDQFVPKFMMGEHDCSTSPAEFKPGMSTPQVQADNGTIYGQVFPAKEATDHSLIAEIHYYHLWRKDCGGRGHPLDTEHVAVLVRASDTHLMDATWKALYWYAAAHEKTVCDVSQITRAATLRAEDHGTAVWISPGKHASYLNEGLCQEGCGADRCRNMVPLRVTALINLGEPGHPMNGSLFIISSAWPLMAKMSTSNFPSSSIGRLNLLREDDIAWFNPGRHPAQGVIAKSSTTEQAIAGSGRNTVEAISSAGNSTGDALSTANESTDQALSLTGDATGNALKKSYRNIRHAVSTSVRHAGDALHLHRRGTEEQPH